MIVLYTKIAKVLKLGDRKALHSNAKVLKQRKHVVKMLVLMVISFTVGWSFIYILHIYSAIITITRGNIQTEVFKGLLVPALFLVYGKAAVNPIMYTFLSKRHRKVLMDMLKCWRKVPPEGASEISILSNSTAHSTDKSR